MKLCSIHFTIYFIIFYGLRDASDFKLGFVETRNDCTFYNMFTKCYNLIYGPTELSTIPNSSRTYIYSCMFKQCTSLIKAPKLPDITSVCNNCYREMFNGCTSLTEAPELSASKVLTSNSYSQMFYNCSKLNKITTKQTAWGSTSTDNWVYGVSATGTFYKLTVLPEEFGPNRIPNGWTVVNID